MTLKQELNSEKRWKMAWKAKSLICFWLSCVVFLWFGFLWLSMRGLIFIQWSVGVGMIFLRVACSTSFVSHSLLHGSVPEVNRVQRSTLSLPVIWPVTIFVGCQISLAGAAKSSIFVAVENTFVTTNICLSWQSASFVATKHVFCHNFVATKICLLWQNFCHNKYLLWQT